MLFHVRAIRTIPRDRRKEVMSSNVDDGAMGRKPRPLRPSVRGNTPLKAVQITRDQSLELNEVAIRTGHPKRWHLERMIRIFLDDQDFAYEVRDLRKLADRVILASPRTITLQEAVARLIALCENEGVPKPHSQTGRKHLREAAVASGLAFAELRPREVRAFTPEEDLCMAVMRKAGYSLSAIGHAVSRRPNVVLRRLRVILPG